MRAFSLFLVLALIIGCSESTPPGPGTSKTSKVAPAVSKDKDSKNEPAPTKSDEKAVALVEEAIKAHGGMDALGKLAAIERNVKGTYLAEKRELNFTAESMFQLPSRLRTVLSLDAGEVKSAETIVVNGEQGWQVNAGETNPLPDQRLQENREQLYAYGATTLLPLRDVSVVLVTADGEPVDGKPTAAVRAVKKDRPDIRLYFDKASGLLVKIAYRGKLAGGIGDMEIQLLDHKEVDGAKIPYRQVEFLNGAKLADWTLTNIRVGRRFDGGLFGKP
jgi:hypothetical protein